MACRQTEKNEEVRFDATFTVEYRHTVLWTHHLFNVENNVLADFLHERAITSLFIVIDSILERCCPTLQADCTAYLKAAGVQLTAWKSVPGGEKLKTDNGESVLAIQKLAAKKHMSRTNAFMAIGGGALLDAVGYAAATFHRGARLIRVPTTVLAQCDSAMGVKNGLDLGSLKNAVGTFAVPTAVICDLEFLKLLPEKVFREGFSELVKVAAIRDKRLLEEFVKSSELICKRVPDVYERFVIASARLHYDHIVSGGDPFERGNGRPLDFGHWLAHRLEEASGYTISHGEAVAVGVCLDAQFAMGANFITSDDFNLIIEALERCGLRNAWEKARQFMGKNDLELALDEFREHLGGKLLLTFPNPLGKSIDVPFDDKRMKSALIKDWR